MKKYSLQNLDCANCAARIETAVLETPGVHRAVVDFATGNLYLEADDLQAVKRTIHYVEPEVSLESKTNTSFPVQHLRQLIFRIGIAVSLFIIGVVFREQLANTPFGMGEWVVFGVAYVISGHTVLTKAYRNILRGQIFDENFLMTVATLGAILIGELPEAVGVMVFYMVGEFAQEVAVSKSRRSIQSLLEIRPDTANLVVDGQIQGIKPENVNVGDLLQVRPGERIPLDGDIETGESYVDTSALTGETKPRKVKPGDQILSGMINQSGLLQMVVTRTYAESSIQRILELVENASSRKARTERFITKFARVYSPIVVALAAVTAILPPILTGDPFMDWLYRALVVLVISCPCALVISIPLGYFGGIGGASSRGILVKGSGYLDRLAQITTVVFDKTGTLTEGKFQVTDVITQNNFSENDLLRYAALAEAKSNHPIAQSILEAYRPDDTQPSENGDMVKSYEETAGYGVVARIGEQEILVGSDKFLHKANIPHEKTVCNLGGTVVHVAVDKVYAGCLVISDRLKESAPQAVRDLRALGVKQILMLTGDVESSAEKFTRHLGLDGFSANLLPGDKLNEVEKLLNSQEIQGTLAFVGDGINDAPALARADLGIAMGALGSDAAIESADVVMMTDAPSKIAEAIKIGRRTRNIVWQNIIFALFAKSIFILLGLVGFADMWMAVIGDMGVALIAVANSMRVLKSDP